MGKTLSYKIDAFVKETGYSSYKGRTYDPVITHNIPEEYIVVKNELGSIKTYTQSGYISHIYFYISENQYESIKNKIIWPSEICDGICYLGAIVLRTNYDGKNFDILCWLHEKTFNNVKYITLIPCNYIDKSVWSGEMYTLPNRSIKIFYTKDDWKNDQSKKEAERLARYKKSWEQRDEVTAGAPTFSFTTPKFKILNIVKKTDWVKDAKVGDIIHGEMPIINTNNGKAVGCLHGGMSYSNYVAVYLNGNKVRSISPLTFQELFLNNYKVEEIK